MLSVDRVSKWYRVGGLFSQERKQVLHDICFEWKPGECLAVIGESGSGKSTLGRLLLGIEKPDRGTVRFNGKSVSDRKTRIGNVSAVFQDYTSSMNPYYTVEKALLEPLSMQRRERSDMQRKIDSLLCQVGLNPSYRDKYPHELSGGEAQRVCIARAVAAEPSCIVFDEAVSSLDGSVQIQVLELLNDLKNSFGMGFIFITHDIEAAAYLCDRAMFLRSGRVEEIVSVKELKNVQSSYAKKLLQMMIT
ncbi:ABC transporter ATP-binding protein [Paenibacillus antri]|uniref:ABC transporter ATP-binding protein n=1 Tax=Paenibacillus antri TaxID=2582848 RepID=A0A5R9GGK1_9BACL|nr:ABC transporter ATP-binding protein [Paenibacillus antri]TLS52444.1 ABC transporter ATP-binding protein [Paenibacillus antri]